MFCYWIISFPLSKTNKVLDRVNDELLHLSSKTATKTVILFFSKKNLQLSVIPEFFVYYFPHLKNDCVAKQNLLNVQNLLKISVL